MNIQMCLSKDLSRVSSCHEISENHEVACDQIAMISCPATVGVTGCDSSVAKFCDNIAGSTASKDDTSIDTPKSKMILPVESGAKKETKLRCTSSNCGSDVLSAEPNGMNGRVVSLIESYISGDPHYSESASENYFSPTVMELCKGGELLDRIRSRGGKYSEEGGIKF
ncbi:hypothetical protein ACSBR2_042320 [Camellia fascicularis]